MCVRGLQKCPGNGPAASGCSVHLIRLKRCIKQLPGGTSLAVHAQIHHCCVVLVANIATAAHSGTWHSENIALPNPLSKSLVFKATAFGLCLNWFHFPYFPLYRNELVYFPSVWYSKVGRCCVPSCANLLGTQCRKLCK